MAPSTQRFVGWFCGVRMESEEPGQRRAGHLNAVGSLRTKDKPSTYEVRQSNKGTEKAYTCFLAVEMTDSLPHLAPAKQTLFPHRVTRESGNTYRRTPPRRVKALTLSA
ncbi:uncharacterized protein F5147DRAFT_653246 [Suillus discolor]|uniref:Uncharacterized protein n=1 Tax=Suillus discolor TaxID=1912936 RepID=A0A9P7JTS8_9AGAM|nr:uncharacterized protein F5147DRAFT_653246 [Suillus discolor]KAG2107735.1 hypothetical protein F5147DRAFT_653246 [Suillus discolor]